MSDNVTANAGSGGATFATDEIESVQYPRSKIVIGADGVNDGDVSATNPMPVVGPLTDDELRASAVPVSGPLTDTQLRATAVPVDGSGVTQPVSVSNFPATQPVSGTISVDAVPLASGAATSEKQDAGNVSVASIDGKITTCNTGEIAGTVTISAALPAGDNNVGNVDVLTLPATPAGTNLIGKTACGQDVDSLYQGATALAVKYANIDVTSSGDNAIVAAVSGKTLKVISVFLAASGAVDVYFNDGTANLLGGTRKVKLDNTGAAGAGGFALQNNPTGWFKTAGTNRPINLNLSGAVGVAGCLAYVEES